MGDLMGLGIRGSARPRPAVSSSTTGAGSLGSAKVAAGGGMGRMGRFKARTAGLYKRYIVEGLLRQRPLPPSPDGRHIPLDQGAARRKPLTDERSGQPYISNVVRSTRYTVWSFVPKQLVFQFMKLANFYFLVVGILQMIPGLSTTGTWTTIGPLMLFVSFSMAKEGYDDYRRYKLDKVENRSAVWVLDPERTVASRARTTRRAVVHEKPSGRPEDVENEAWTAGSEGGMGTREGSDAGQWSLVQWQDLRVGDIIQLGRDENVPADIVLLYASGPNGSVYIETMALDGETNLKSKQAAPLLARQWDPAAGMNPTHATVVSEDPNLDLYNYEGRVTVRGESKPLTMKEVVYRGSTVRNTAQAIGLVINTGEECKIRMNAHKNKHAKAPAMQGIVNRIVLALVLLVALLTVGFSVGNHVWVSTVERFSWYLDGARVLLTQIVFGFIIMFNTLIPLSLYISLEIIKIGQFILLQDVDMYDFETNTPMVANTTTILENLGQVGYVFSDKTGTLTENKMQFRKMSVAGTAWLHDADLVRHAEEKEKNAQMTKMSKRQVTSSSEDRASGTLVSEKPSSPSSSGGMESADTALTDGPGPRRQSMPPSRPPGEQDHAQPGLNNTEDLVRYISRNPQTTYSRKARHLVLCLALCHTCLPETTDSGEIRFQAASPDEVALVQAARDLGYLLIDRPAESIKLQFHGSDGSLATETYEVLNVIDFSSKRKRMSIIVRMPDGRICMFSKGADSVILPRLKLHQLALQKAAAAERRASRRRSVEQAQALRRISAHGAGLESLNIARRSTNLHRDVLAQGGDENPSTSPRQSVSPPKSDTEPLGPVADDGARDDLVDERLAVDDDAVFERCFQHVDDFATEGLRTLLYAYRYIDEDEHKMWEATYREATASLVNRQESTEAAADLIEKDLDLAGATAIEDKLQQGVPETIDKLRRANIKVWMLTGDKRQTAINIAHSARVCMPFSETYILDVEDGGLDERMASILADVGRGSAPHTVAVIDGHTLGVVEADEEMKALFFDLAARVDSVICCRASPSQKATLVQCVRQRMPKSMTLAIGDGANDVAMIQASHVGIGISGREGLQAARISDFSIAQFRFLQRLLFVHGRWNYLRTGKYILATFWKEIVFYLTQAQFQAYTGYTGTSLFENYTLMVFNTLFSSLAVILPGIFEQDLRAETLLAVPELYTFGQRNQGFNYKKWLGWMIMAAADSVIIFNTFHAVYAVASYPVDTSLYAMGTLVFSVCVLFINIKLLALEVHYKTIIPAIGLLITVGGWFFWTLVLGAITPVLYAIYTVRSTFVQNFGRNALWWLTGMAALSAVIVLDLVASSIRRVYFPTDQDIMQEVEKLGGGVADVAAENGEAGDFAGRHKKGPHTGRPEMPPSEV